MNQNKDKVTVSGEGSSERPNAKLIALYFPQFHAIPENDRWWGKGFTDWKNVKTAKPQFSGHYQPRIPSGDNYYDQSKLEIIRWQIDLAKKHHIYGFCHYHYWFDGKQLLETPTNLFLKNKDIVFPFCLSWANETWSRRWDGRDHHILIQQTHPPTRESWKKHFDYLIEAWTDPRAIKVDGKPVFIIYRPQRINKIDEMLSYWRELAQQEGLKGLYFIMQKQYELPNRDSLGSFDAIFQFQPFEAIYSRPISEKLISHSLLLKWGRRLPLLFQNFLVRTRDKVFKRVTFHNYDAIWEEIVKIRPDPELTTYPCAFVDWDNTARYKKSATVFQEVSPEKFARWFDRLVDSMPQRNLPENLIFLNAWNEWSEGTYLEPDKRYDSQYLSAVKDVLQKPRLVKGRVKEAK